MLSDHRSIVTAAAHRSPPPYAVVTRPTIRGPRGLSIGSVASAEPSCLSGQRRKATGGQATGNSIAAVRHRSRTRASRRIPAVGRIVSASQRFGRYPAVGFRPGCCSQYRFDTSCKVREGICCRCSRARRKMVVLSLGRKTDRARPRHASPMRLRSGVSSRISRSYRRDVHSGSR